MADALICSNCGAAIQYDEGKLTQTHFAEDGIGLDYRCEKCAGPILAEALVLGQSVSGSYHLGHNILKWECKADPEVTGILGGIARAFVLLVARVMDTVAGGKRRAAAKALTRLVGEGAPHEDTCECLRVGESLTEFCPYCQARLALAIQPGA